MEGGGGLMLMVDKHVLDLMKERGYFLNSLFGLIVAIILSSGILLF